MQITTTVEVGKRVHRRKPKTGLSRLAEARLRAALRRTTPSEPWVDVQFIDVEAKDERGRTIILRAFQPGAFPPGGSETSMIRCHVCGVLTPPGALENGICLDHGDHASWGPSPSAQAIRGLQYRNLRMAEIELLPESAAALQHEIDRHENR